MNDFLTALGLLLVFEGVLYGGFPGAVRRMAEQIPMMTDSAMRMAGLVAAFCGLFLVWLVRG